MSAESSSWRDAMLRRESLRTVKRAAAGLSEHLESTTRLALERQGLLREVLGPQTPVAMWAHQPPDDAYDPDSGYRWYYHCHAREARLAGEHGHFHLFSDRSSGTSVTHLIAISVDDRGLPLGLFTTNRWVTDECWQPATSVLRLIQHFSMASPPGLWRVHQWLSSLLRAFAPQLRHLIQARDRRLSELRQSANSDVMEDRRIAVLSRCAVDVTRQARALDRRLIAV